MSENTTDNYTAATNQADMDGKTGSKRDEPKGVGHKRTLITAAKRYREKSQFDEKLTDFIKIYANKYDYEELSDYDDIVVPNMVFSTVNVIVPSIAINSPEILVYPDQQEDLAFAETAQAMLNHQWRQIRAQDHVRAAAKDFVIGGIGVGKVTWEFETEEVDRPIEEVQMDLTQRIMSKRLAVEENPDMESDFPSDEEIAKSVPRTVEKVKYDRPKVQRVSPFDVFFDPDVDVFADLRWVAHRMFVPLSEARTNEDWDAAARRSLKPTRRPKAREDQIDMDDSKVDDHSEGDEAFVEIYEFYDLLKKEVCVFAEASNGYLLKPEKSVFPQGHPFVWVENFEVPERLYPIGDVEMIFPLQLELAMTRTAQLNDRKRGRRITLFREEALGSTGVEKLRAGADNVMLNVTSSNFDFDNVFRQISSQGLQPEWYQADRQAMEDINTVSGIAEYMRGGQADIRRTATEVGVMADVAQSRQADKLAKIESFMSQIAERMLVLSQKFLETEQVARIVTDQQAVNWVPYSSDRIQGEYTVTVVAGSAQPRNESQRRQQANQLMQSFGNLIGSGYLNDQEFIKEVLQLNGFTDVERLIGPGPAPMPPEEPPPGAPPGAMPV